MTDIRQSDEVALHELRVEVTQMAHKMASFADEIRYVGVKGYTNEELEVLAQDMETEILMVTDSISNDIMIDHAPVWADGGGILDSADELLRMRWKFGYGEANR